MGESSGTDEGAVGGVLDDLGDGGDPGITTLGYHGDGEAIEVCGEGAGIALEASAPDAALDLGRGPSRDGFRGCGRDRRDRLLHGLFAGGGEILR